MCDWVLGGNREELYKLVTQFNLASSSKSFFVWHQKGFIKHSLFFNSATAVTANWHPQFRLIWFPSIFACFASLWHSERGKLVPKFIQNTILPIKLDILNSKAMMMLHKWGQYCSDRIMLCGVCENMRASNFFYTQQNFCKNYRPSKNIFFCKFISSLHFTIIPPSHE